MFGIANCDTVKKAKKWLEQHAIEYTFHDYKKLGVDEAVINHAIKCFGIDVVVNKRGTTYRKLSDHEKSNINESNVLALLTEHTSMIKRPILTIGEEILIGFDAEKYTKAFHID